MKYEIPSVSSSVIKEAKSKVGISVRLEGGGHRNITKNLPKGSIVRRVQQKIRQAYYK